MNQWRRSLLTDLEKIDTVDGAFDALAPAVRALGFELYAYALRVSVPITRSNTMSWSNYPEAWRALYEERHYQAIDPVLQYGHRCTKPMVWPDLVSDDGAFWRDAASFGLKYGWSQTIRDHRGVIGTFSMVRSEPKITQDELNRAEPEMIWLGQFAHATISNRIVPKVLPLGAARLSPREKEILHWTAEGKTAAEVATILQLSERNVGFHVQNAIDKLDAANKTHATVKAALLGLIPIG
jgi:DNA-binding CsgD family transcriptional regulator